jgi:hypothetical protein
VKSRLGPRGVVQRGLPIGGQPRSLKSDHSNALHQMHGRTAHLPKVSCEKTQSASTLQYRHRCNHCDATGTIFL